VKREVFEVVFCQKKTVHLSAMSANAVCLKLDQEAILLINGWNREQMNLLSPLNVPVAITKLYGAFWNTRNECKELFELDFKKGRFFCYVALSTMFKAIDYFYKISFFIGKLEISVYTETFKYKVINNHCVEMMGEMKDESLCIDENEILQLKVNKFGKMRMENGSIYKMKQYKRYYEKLGYSRDGEPISNEGDDRLFWSCEERPVLRCIVTITRDVSALTRTSISISIFTIQGIFVLFCVYFFACFLINRKKIYIHSS